MFYLKFQTINCGKRLINHILYITHLFNIMIFSFINFDIEILFITKHIYIKFF